MKYFVLVLFLFFGQLYADVYRGYKVSENKYQKILKEIPKEKDLYLRYKKVKLKTNISILKSEQVAKILEIGFLENSRLKYKMLKRLVYKISDIENHSIILKQFQSDKEPKYRNRAIDLLSKLDKEKYKPVFISKKDKLLGEFTIQRKENICGLLENTYRPKDKIVFKIKVNKKFKVKNVYLKISYCKKLKPESCETPYLTQKRKVSKHKMEYKTSMVTLDTLLTNQGKFPIPPEYKYFKIGLRINKKDISERMIRLDRTCIYDE